MVLHIPGVDLGHDQGHVGIQPEGGGIVHKHGAGLYNGGGELLGNVIFGGAQHNVHTRKSLVPGFQDGYVFTPEL